MKGNFLNLATLIGLLGSASVYAGNDMGNGGDAVSCPYSLSDFGGANVVLLDYYESLDYFGPVSLGDANLSVPQKVTLALGRLAKVDPDRAQKYLSWFNTFEQETSRKRGQVLTDIPDSLHVSLPKDCKVEQLVIQKEPQTPWEKRFIVNQDLYEQMSADHQAGMILHELIYREALEVKQTNSIRSRAFNGILSTEEFEKFSVIDFMKWREKYINFPEFPHTVLGMKFKLGTVEFYNSGKLKTGIALAGDFEFQAGPNCIWNGSFDKNGKLLFANNGHLEFSELGGLGAIYLSSGKCAKIPTDWIFSEGLYSTGVPRAITMGANLDAHRWWASSAILFNDESVKFYGHASFQENGIVKRGLFIPYTYDGWETRSCGSGCNYSYRRKCGESAEDNKFTQSLMTNNGRRKEFSCQVLEFDDFGRVIVD